MERSAETGIRRRREEAQSTAEHDPRLPLETRVRKRVQIYHGLSSYRGLIESPIAYAMRRLSDSSGPMHTLGIRGRWPRRLRPPLDSLALDIITSSTVTIVQVSPVDCPLIIVILPISVPAIVVLAEISDIKHCLVTRPRPRLCIRSPSVGDPSAGTRVAADLVRVHVVILLLRVPARSRRRRRRRKSVGTVVIVLLLDHTMVICRIAIRQGQRFVVLGHLAVAGASTVQQ